MVWIPGGTFRMGSDDHYPEEAPVHGVTVEGFWMDKYQVTNARFAIFVRDTGYVTVAERPPDPELYPDAPAENLVPGSLVFQKTRGPVDLRHINQWWAWTPGAQTTEHQAVPLPVSRSTSTCWQRCQTRVSSPPILEVRRRV